MTELEEGKISFLDYLYENGVTGDDLKAGLNFKMDDIFSALDSIQGLTSNINTLQGALKDQVGDLYDFTDDVMEETNAVVKSAMSDVTGTISEVSGAVDAQVIEAKEAAQNSQKEVSVALDEMTSEIFSAAQSANKLEAMQEDIVANFTTSDEDFSSLTDNVNEIMKNTIKDTDMASLQLSDLAEQVYAAKHGDAAYVYDDDNDDNDNNDDNDEDFNLPNMDFSGLLKQFDLGDDYQIYNDMSEVKNKDNLAEGQGLFYIYEDGSIAPAPGTELDYDDIMDDIDFGDSSSWSIFFAIGLPIAFVLILIITLVYRKMKRNKVPYNRFQNDKTPDMGNLDFGDERSIFERTYDENSTMNQ